MTEFFMRKDDPLTPIYEVDFENETWRLVASVLGKVDLHGSLGGDDGVDFKGAKFVPVWKLKEDGDLVIFTETPPAKRH